LQELGPLSQFRELDIGGLEKVPSGSFAAKAKIDDKQWLSGLVLLCSDCNLDEVTEEDCQRVEEVFDQLCPPSNLEQLAISHYLGRRAPSWMCMTQDASVDFNSLRGLDMDGLPFCTQLPDGLCKLPNLEGIVINSAPAIERVGPEFQQTGGSIRSLVRSSFPKLQHLQLIELIRGYDRHAQSAHSQDWLLQAGLSPCGACQQQETRSEKARAVGSHQDNSSGELPFGGGARSE